MNRARKRISIPTSQLAEILAIVVYTQKVFNSMRDAENQEQHLDEISKMMDTVMCLLSEHFQTEPRLATLKRVSDEMNVVMDWQVLSFLPHLWEYTVVAPTSRNN